MVTEDLVKLPDSLPEKTEANETCSNDIEPSEVIYVESNIDDIKEKLRESPGRRVLDSENGETFSILDADLHGDLVADTSDVDMEVDPPEPLHLLDRSDAVGIGLTSENGALSLTGKNDATGDVVCSISLATLSRKRARTEHDDADQPSVHVTYKSLRSSSRQKLEELLNQWSKWHAQHCASSPDASEEVHSGEETFFPALQVGVEKPSAVSFWIDQQTLRVENEGVISFDTNTVPLYDRGYSLGLNTEDYSNNLEGGLEIMGNAARCFNCGSYSHSLKECPKPRDNVAVHNARKHHWSRRNQNAATRSATRYYQDTPTGKFNGLKPGALDSETRKLLGLGELDPPPWLNRMRELGYPPGYLVVDVDDQPSGIIMFADEEVKEDDMDGGIAETRMGPPKKKAVKFPGINTPIPENADEGRWADLPSISKSSSHQSHDRTSHSSLPINVRYVQDHRWSGYTRDDPPPGTESVLSPLPFHNSIPISSQLSRSLDSFEMGGLSPSHSYHSFRGYASSGSGGQHSLPHHDGRYGQSVDVGRHYYDRDHPMADWRGSIYGHHRDGNYPTEGGRGGIHGHHSWR